MKEGVSGEGVKGGRKFVGEDVREGGREGGKLGAVSSPDTKIFAHVNYIFSYQQHLLWRQKIYKLDISGRIMQFTLPEQSDWCDNMPICSYDYAPFLPVNFSTRPQGARKKFGVWR